MSEEENQDILHLYFNDLMSENEIVKIRPYGKGSVSRAVKRARNDGLRRSTKNPGLLEHNENHAEPVLKVPVASPPMLERTPVIPKSHTYDSEVLFVNDRQPSHNRPLDLNVMTFVLAGIRDIPDADKVSFLNSFKWDRIRYVAEPESLRMSLCFTFGGLLGREIFSLFMAIRPNPVPTTKLSPSVPTAPMPPMPSYGGTYGDYDPRQALMTSPRYQQMLLHDQIEEMRDQRKERRMDRLYRGIMLRSRQRTAYHGFY